MTEQKVAIIMPVYNSADHLEAALDSIVNNTEYLHWRLILVCSESNDGTEQICADYCAAYENVNAFYTKKEGITKAINFGIAQTTKDEDIYLTQDDVILPDLYGRDWLEILVGISQLPNCGLATTLGVGGISGPHYLKGLRWYGTWSLYIPRKTINKIGVFDEAFSPGPGDDIDYSYRVQLAKLRVYMAEFWVDHHRSTQNFNDSSEMQQRGGRTFQNKYGIKIDKK